MRMLAPALLILALPATLYAQTPEDAVRATVDRLFDGMRAGDSTMVASVFYEGAVLGRATGRLTSRSGMRRFGM